MRLVYKIAVLVFCLAGFTNCKPAQDNASVYWTYISVSGNSENGAGIEIYEWNPSVGKLTLVHKDTQVKGSKYVTANADKNYLYSVNMGTLSAFDVNQKDGSLALKNQHAYANEKGGYISLDNSGSTLLSSLYFNGQFRTFQLGTDGEIKSEVTQIQYTGKSTHPKRQTKAHPHMAVQPNNSSLVFVPDLGTDKLHTYALDQNGHCQPSNIPFVKLPDGVGPRYVAFHPHKAIVYIVAELTSEVYAYAYNAEKGITNFINKTSILPEDFTAYNTSADIAITPDGKFLYASNRGHNSIAICKIDEDNGAVTLLHTVASGGEIPREFIVDPTHQYLLVANQQSNTVCVFKIDADNGHLTLKQTVETGNRPQGFAFIKADKKSDLVGASAIECIPPKGNYTEEETEVYANTKMPVEKGVASKMKSQLNFDNK